MTPSFLSPQPSRSFITDMWMTLLPFLDQRMNALSFLNALNSMHLALKFTFEKEEIDQLLFLEVLVKKSNEGFLTSGFRKSTFTGQYFYWNLLGPTKCKNQLD